MSFIGPENLNSPWGRDARARARARVCVCVCWGGLLENTIHCYIPLTLKVPETKIAEFANSVDLDEVAHDEPPHLDLHCSPIAL